VLVYSLETVFGEKGLVPRVKEAATRLGLEWKDYVSVCHLMTHEASSAVSVPKASIIYVHSKAIVVDDKYAIVGSANINDRSMAGDRDSEVALLFEGHAFARDLRTYLMGEHLGLLGPDGSFLSEDTPQGKALQGTITRFQNEEPWSDWSYGCWNQRAMGNSDAFQHVFPYLPSNKLTTVSQFREKVQAEQDRRARFPNQTLAELLDDAHDTGAGFGDFEHLKRIRGHVVHYPIKFLIDDIKPGPGPGGNLWPWSPKGLAADAACTFN